MAAALVFDQHTPVPLDGAQEQRSDRVATEHGIEQVCSLQFAPHRIALDERKVPGRFVIAKLNPHELTNGEGDDCLRS